MAEAMPRCRAATRLAKMGKLHSNGGSVAVFRSFWYGGSLSPYEWMCLKSFVEHGHSFLLYSYEEIDVPFGVRLLDASEIFEEDEVFLYTEGTSAGSPSAFSNHFRYELLRRYGGWWCDTDVICLSDRMPEQDLVFAYEDRDRINGAVLKIAQGHNIAQQLQSEAKILGKNIRWGQAGPLLITRLVRLNKLERFAVPTELVYPVHYSRALDFLVPDRAVEVSAKVKGSIFVHLWNEVFRRAPIIKEVAPPADSFLHEQFCRYGVTFPSGIRYTAYQIQRIVDTNADLETVTSQIAQSKARLESLETELNTMAEKYAATLAELNAISQSILWKATGPARRLLASTPWLTRPFRWLRGR
jgi:hypothetical protein